jgi:hypothetical protein
MLDSTSAGYKLTDQGMVVNNPMNTAACQFSTIDPGPNTFTCSGTKAAAATERAARTIWVARSQGSVNRALQRHHIYKLLMGGGLD